jgi:hypothetical protein
MTKTLRLFACLAFIGSAATGCMATQADIDQAELEEAGLDGQGEVASTEEALTRGGNNKKSLGFTCTGTSCECDKSIENDCENMSGVCSDATVDALITCIGGWATTHCVCTLGLVRPTQPIIKANVVGSVGTFAIAR